jgi:Tol biopolymer transport system component
MAADGSAMHRVRTDTRAFNDDTPTLFPGGARIAFARCRSDFAGCVIATMRRDGTHLRVLTRPRHEVYDMRPAVSPDGRRIAFSRINADGVAGRVWIMRRDGSHAHPVTAARYEAYGPDWAPNGERLLYSSNCCRLGGNVFTSDLAGSAVRQITHTRWPRADENGVFSPTGGRIAVASGRRHANRCCVDLFTAPLRGGPATRVPLPVNHVDKVDWAPRRP